MMDVLEVGITTLGRTVSGISSSNLFLDNAPHSQQGAYCVFFGLPSGREWDSVNDYPRLNYQFSFFGDTKSEVKTLCESFKSTFDFSNSLSVTGYGVEPIVPILETPARYVDEVWQIDLEYQFQLSIARS